MRFAQHHLAAVVLALVGALVSPLAAAKLPPPTDDAKAKAAEAAPKTAWDNKVAGFQLCKSMDKTAAKYHAALKAAGKEVKVTETPPCADPGPFVAAPTAATAPASPAASASAPKS